MNKVVFSKIKILILMLIYLCINTLHAADVNHDSFSDVLAESAVDGQVNYSKIKSNPKYFSYLKALEKKATLQTKAKNLPIGSMHIML